MRTLLGNLQHHEFEPPQLVRYEKSEQFHLHYDWFEQSSPGLSKPYNRLASIFAYLGDECTGGETYFPHIPAVSSGLGQDKFLKGDDNSLAIKPVRGNAIFWVNLHPNGTGDERVLHAGLPVRSGVKFGLNLWSHYDPKSPMAGD